jgi:hypothetical protein
MARYLFQHVVKKGHAGGDLAVTGPIKIDGRLNLRFQGVAFYVGLTVSHGLSPVTPVENKHCRLFVAHVR